MARAFLAWFLSFTIAVPGWALSPEQSRTVTDFLKTTGISSRSVPWKEFYAKIEKDLPFDVKREMRLFIKQNPNAKLPQVVVTKINEGESETIQLEFRVGADQAFLRIEGKSDFASLKGVQGGKKFDQKISKYELQNPVRWIASMSGVEQTLTEKVPTVQVLSAEQVKMLKPQEKQKYIDRIREVMEAAEKVQNSLTKKNHSSNARGFFWQLVGDEAQADFSGECIVAGYVGHYEGGSCLPPTPARAGECTVCNPEIYGSQPVCAGPKSGKLPLNATEICNSNTASDDKKYAIFQGVGMKNEQDVKKKIESLSGTLTALSEKCKGITADAASKAPDQPSTCAALNSRITELQGVQCTILAKQSAQFPDLKCQGGNADPQIPAPPPVTGPPPAGTTPGAAPGSTTGEGQCIGLPANKDELKPGCKEEQVKTQTCQIEGADPITRYYCECGANQDATKPQTLLPTGCKDKSAAAGDHDRPGHTKPEHNTKQESWFKPWMGVVLAGAAGLGIWYWVSRQNIAAAYPTTVTTATPVPPPVSTTTTILAAPLPVDVNRVTPGTR